MRLAAGCSGAQVSHGTRHLSAHPATTFTSKIKLCNLSKKLCDLSSCSGFSWGTIQSHSDRLRALGKLEPRLPVWMGKWVMSPWAPGSSHYVEATVFVVASSSPLPPPNSFSCVLRHGPFITHMATLGHILFTVGSEMQGILFFPEFISEIMSKFLSAQDRTGT